MHLSMSADAPQGDRLLMSVRVLLGLLEHRLMHAFKKLTETGLKPGRWFEISSLSADGGPEAPETDKLTGQ